MLRKIYISTVLSKLDSHRKDAEVAEEHSFPLPLRGRQGKRVCDTRNRAYPKVESLCFPAPHRKAQENHPLRSLRLCGEPGFETCLSRSKSPMVSAPVQTIRA